MPSTIGRYQIIEWLGDGGMASVYRAYDPHLECEVAVKVIAAHFMHNDQLRERFKQEAKVIAALEHPAIVPVVDFGEQNAFELKTGGDRLNFESIAARFYFFHSTRLRAAEIDRLP